MNSKNKEIERKALANSMINGKIENYKEIDKGCEFTIDPSSAGVDMEELKKAWEESSRYMREIGCVSMGEIDANIEITPEVLRKETEECVDCNNEFAEKGEQILFVDGMYTTVSEETYEGRREVYHFIKKNQHMPKSMFNKNIVKLKEIIDNNDAIIWELPQVTRTTSITNRIVTSPKRTALLFEKWMREENSLKFNYDDICVKFENHDGVERFVVRMNKKFIEKVEKQLVS